jgi:hypothetical protein
METIDIKIEYSEIVKRKNRVETTLQFDYADRVPVIPYIRARYYLEKIGYLDKIRDYLDQPKTMLQCPLLGQKWIFENTNTDFYNPVVYPDFMWVEDVNAFGAEVEVPMDDSPWVARPHLIKKDEDLVKLREVDYINTGMHGKMINYYRKMKEIAADYQYRFSDGKIIEATEIVRPGGSGILGLIGIANDLYGTENFSIALYDKPDWAKELLQIICDKSIEWIEHVLELSGGDAGFCSDRYNNIVHVGDDGTAQLSYDQVVEFSLVPFKKLADFIRSKGCEVQAHNCGRADHLLDFWSKDVGIDRYYGFSYLTDRSSIKEKMGGRIKLFGGIDTTLLLNGSPEEVTKYTENTLKILKNVPGYIIMDGHNIAPGTPTENINAMTSASKQFGSF